MPAKSKQTRVSERRALRNKSARSRTKKVVSQALGLLKKGELEPGQQAVVTAVKALDRSAERGIIHPNNAARRKSRLVRKLNKAQVSAQPPETK